MSKIEISIPDFWNNFNINLFLIDLINREPHKFVEDVQITSCYGSFPCIWNGGRTITGTTNIQNIKDTIKPFNDRGISIRYTFTNKFIDEYTVHDPLGNTILELSCNEHCKNGVNVNSMTMKDYIENNYTQFYIMFSTTCGLQNIDVINSLTEKYLIVPDYNVNNDFNKIKQFIHPENIELLIGEACIDSCPNRTNHHTDCSMIQCYRDISQEHFICPNGCEGSYSFYETIPCRHHYISMEDIKEKYLPLGINKFKISGRNDPWPNIIERYVHWLVKDEYKDEIRNKLILKQIST